MQDFIEILTKQAEWSEETFGPGPRTEGVLDHIESEFEEIRVDPSDLEEWIDMVILSLDGARRAGYARPEGEPYSPEAIRDMLIYKMNKNFGRVWPDWRLGSPDKRIEHDRSHD